MTLTQDSLPTPHSTHPVLMVPGALEALRALEAAIKHSGLLSRTLDLVNVRASQINGCSECIELHAHALAQAGECDARLDDIAAWRDTPGFTEADRAALALTEVVTRLSDRATPIPDDVWDEAAAHFDPVALAALVLNIGHVNLWNRASACAHRVTLEQACQ